MTPTPHPADALPLPELPNRVLRNAEIIEYVRAAHREGYELAMSKRAELQRDLDDARIVLRRQERELKQLKLTALAAPAQEQPKSDKPAEFVGWYCAHCQRGVDASEVTFHEQHTVCGRVITNDEPPKHQQAGTAEVSDEQIKEVFAMHIGKDAEDYMVKVGRAILALKATAGGVAEVSDAAIEEIEARIWKLESLDDTERQANKEFARAIWALKPGGVA